MTANAKLSMMHAFSKHEHDTSHASCLTPSVVYGVVWKKRNVHSERLLFTGWVTCTSGCEPRVNIATQHCFYFCVAHVATQMKPLFGNRLHIYLWVEGSPWHLA